MADAEKGEVSPEPTTPLTGGNPGLKASIRSSAKNKDPTSCCTSFMKALMGSVVSTAVMFLTLGVPIAMMYVGIKYKDDCPRQPLIPVYLIVFGTFILIKLLWTVIQRIKGHINKEEEIPCEGAWHDALISFFLAIWFICGSVWIYGVYNTVDFENASDDAYCNKTAYNFAFWMTSLFYLAVWIGLILICCIRFMLFSVCDYLMEKTFD